MQYIVERFEGEIAVIEAGEEMISVGRDLLPTETHEGDVLIKKGERFLIEKEETERLKEEVRRLKNKLWD